MTNVKRLYLRASVLAKTGYYVKKYVVANNLRPTKALVETKPIQKVSIMLEAENAHHNY